MCVHYAQWRARVLAYIWPRGPDMLLISFCAVVRTRAVGYFFFPSEPKMSRALGGHSWAQVSLHLSGGWAVDWRFTASGLEL